MQRCKDKFKSKINAVECCNWGWMQFMSEGDDSAQETAAQTSTFNRFYKHDITLNQFYKPNMFTVMIIMYYLNVIQSCYVLQTIFTHVCKFAKPDLESVCCSRLWLHKLIVWPDPLSCSALLSVSSSVHCSRTKCSSAVVQ